MSGELLYVTEAGDGSSESRRSRDNWCLAVNGLQCGAIYAGLAQLATICRDELGTTGERSSEVWSR